MPELPEVESLRRALQSTIVGHRFVGVDVRLAKMFRAGEWLTASDLRSARVEQISRRGKHLLLTLSGGLALIFHLRLAGQLVLVRDGEVVAAGGHPVPAFGSPLPHRSTHVTFELDDGSRLYFTDIRQFGFCRLMRLGDAARYLADQEIGPDPLDAGFSVEVLAGVLTRRQKARLKPLLLDQRSIAGLGNIYVDEALWRAALHPLRAAGSLDPDEVRRLHEAIVGTLQHALTHGVARVINGRADPARDFPAAHGREGDPCPRCRGAIARIRLGGRSTYFCPACQPGATSAAS